MLYYFNVNLSVMKYFNHSEAYVCIKTCSQSHLFTNESINTCENVETFCLYYDFFFLPIFKFPYRSFSPYFNILLLLSGDTSLNAGPFHKDKLQFQSEWSIFNSRELHFIHLNVNSLSPKIDELKKFCQII